MAFDYERLNPQVLDDLKPIFAKRSSEWSSEERSKVLLSLEAIHITAKISEPLKPKLLINWVEFAEHLLAIEALTPNGSNEGWAKDLIYKTKQYFMDDEL